MKFILPTLLVFTAPTLTIAAPAPNPAPAAAAQTKEKPPLPPSGNCVVNALGVGVWHEYGLSRQRTKFSGYGTDRDGNELNVGEFCDKFRLMGEERGGSNFSGWLDDFGEGWIVDSSWALRPAGDFAYENTRSLT